MVEHPTLLMTDGYTPNYPPYPLNGHYRDHPQTQNVDVPKNEEGSLPCHCAGCGGRIIDRYFLLAADKQWHVHCLKCCECKLQLDCELTCFARDGDIYCKEDYYRRFGLNKCARCHTGISANELVMKAKNLVFHVGCFSCASCNKCLKTGEQFGMKDSLIYCRTDYELLFEGEFTPSISPGMIGPPGGHMPYYNNEGTVHKGRPRKKKSSCPEADMCRNSLGMGDILCPDDGFGGHGSLSRQKRVRTSFKHHQLRTMKQYFSLNHNPDAKDLKQLAQKTGLSKRVLQVWFQNARAKYRRNMLKQQGQDGDKLGQDGSQSDSNNQHDSASLTDLSGSRSPPLSDISSTPSLSDFQGGSLEEEQSTGSLSDIFSNSMSAIN